VGKGVEARQFLDHHVGDRLAPARWADLRGLGKEAQWVLLPNAAGQVAHGCGRGLRFRGALGRGAIVEEDHGTHQLIAPLDMIDKAEVEVGKSGQRVQPGVSPRVPPLVGGSHSGARKRGSPRASPRGAVRGG
jgi:hypothetical protein